MKWLRIALSLLVLAAAGGAFFYLGAPKPSPITLTDARATVHDMDGATAVAITLSITNEGGPDRILFATSPEAKMAMFHGVTDVVGAPVPAGGTPSLALDGAHVMLMAVQGDMADGRLLPITLTFEEAGEVSTKATLSAGAMGMDMSGQGMTHSMDHSNGMDIPAEMAPTVELTAVQAGEGWRIQAKTDRFTFAPEAMDGDHVPGEGHGHLYIGGIKIMRMTSPEANIGALPAGRHEVRLTLNTNNHMAYRVGGAAISAVAIIDVPG